MAYTTINKSSSYFNTKLYTGTGATNSVTGVGFQPDWVWIKNRTAVTAPVVYDAVRGATKDLYTSTTDAEGTNANGVTSFNSDGFTVGSSGGVNGNTQNIVAWNWLANNTSGSSNTAGTITSTVAANTTAGFSIVSYTGNGSSAQTVGHGLGVVPKMIIVKNRSSAVSWYVYHVSLGNTTEIYLNLTLAASGGSTVWGSTTPTSSVFYNGGNTNTSSANFIAYCFAEVKGYSKFGSWTGDGATSTDGLFVYLGFKPKFFMWKRTDASGYNWYMFDTARDPYNLSTKYILANSSNAEASGINIDFVSNGVKFRDYGSIINASGGTYIYMAFAENPFVTSTQIPVTAR